MIDPPFSPGGPKYDELGRRLDRPKKLVESSSDEARWVQAEGDEIGKITIEHGKLANLALVTR